AEWSAVGEGFDGAVYSLHVFNDGRGPALYVGGNFTHTGSSGTPMPYIARWDGHKLEGVGGGVAGVTNPSDFLPGVSSIVPRGGVGGGAGGVTTPPDFSPGVSSMCTGDEDGAGPLPASLIIGGGFTSAGGVPARSLARWRGGQWSDVGGGVRHAVNAVYVHND